MSKLRAFTMPKWGIEMSEGTISEWNIKEGEPVSKGQIIAQIETDKIVNEVEAEYDTRFVRLIATPGEAYPVGALLAVTSSEAVGADEIDAFVRAFVPAGGEAGAVADQGGSAAASSSAAASAPSPRGVAPQSGALRAFTMPKWGIEMSEGTIGEWNIKEGESVTKGQIIAQIETDKIVNEVEAEYDTRFVRLIATPGQVYPVGALLAVTSSEAVGTDAIDAFVRAFVPAGGEADASSEMPASPSAAVHVRSDAPVSATVSVSTTPTNPAPRENVRIPEGTLLSPAARELALRRSVDVSTIQGSGRRGRITLQDVDQAAKPARSLGGGAAVTIAPTDAALDGFYASPYAKRLAVKHKVDLAKLTGTGPRGRISRQDVAKSAGVSAVLRGGASVEVQRMSPTRKAIARALTLSKSTIPHFYLRAQANMDALLALRAEVKRATGAAPSVNDYLIRAAALALMAAPDVNVQVRGDEIHKFRDADISVAVAADRGLITPVIRAAQTKPVGAIAAELRVLADRARAGKLRADEIEGGSFTVSNLGMFGIDQFDAIINAPQGAILAIGAARRRPIEWHGGLALASVANFSLSCDHRAIDGAVGAGFLKALTELIESPTRL